MSSNGSWSCLEAFFIHLVNPDLIQTPKKTYSKINKKFYYFKTLQKYSQVVIGSFFFVALVNPDEKMD